MPAQISLHRQCNGESRRLKVDPAAPQQNVRTPRAIRQGDALYLQWNGEWLAVRAFDPIAEAEASHQHNGGLTAPMNGSIVRVLVEAGQHVEAGTALIVLEAMKTEHRSRSAQAGVAKSMVCTEGETDIDGRGQGGMDK